MLAEHHPLQGRETIFRKGFPLRLAVAPEAARFSLRLRPEDLEAASAAFGAPLPQRIGEAAFEGGRIAAKLGPDEWLLLAPLAEQEAVEQAFARLYETRIHSLVETGHREIGIEIEGVAAARLLQAAIAFDVEAMAAGEGRRTLIDRTPVVLIRESETRFRLEVWRSFAGHVWGLLQTIGREIDAGL